MLGFASHDWTQWKAINVLCRLAVEGVEREQVAAEITEQLPELLYEAIVPSINQITKLAVYSPALTQRLHDLVTEYVAEDPIEAMEIIGPLIQNAPNIARVHEPLLREILRDWGRRQRHPLLEGQVMSLEAAMQAAATIAAGDIVNPAYSGGRGSECGVTRMGDYSPR